LKEFRRQFLLTCRDMVILKSRLAVSGPAALGTHSNGFASLNGSSHLFRDRSSKTTPPPNFDEIEVLGRRCKEGDFAAWSLLFPKIWPVLVRFVHRLYHSFEQQDAEDVAQASIEAAIRSIDTFSDTGLFRAWLFGIAIRQAATFYRSSSAKKRGTRLLVPFDNCENREDDAKSPADVSAESDRAAILHRAISQLSESDRDLVHLHFFGELTFREIAEARNLNPKTVCTRLTRCKEKLLVSLARFDLTKSDG
jgi:RNA polymerase sigma-70 factor (ECF subfamily)